MANRKFIAAGNWKLNKNIDDAKEFVQTMLQNIPDDLKCEIIISPTFLALNSIAELIKGKPIILAAQNCYSQNDGAFTGEVSPVFLKDAGCTHVILGHSERRTIFHEKDGDIQQKVQAALSEGLIPIFCIGETLEEREKDEVEKILKRQITEGLKNIDINPDKFIVAYEPVWAIGTGKVASPQDAQQAHAFIREILATLYSPDKANATRILYGGSVKPGNINEIINQEDIDGALIGGASLKVDSFSNIIDIINKNS